MGDAAGIRVSDRLRLPAIGAALRVPSVRAGVTRGLLLPITSAAALYAAHLELHALGATRFGFLTLLLAVTLLIPFADLGVGAAVTTAVAADGFAEAHRIVATSFRLLACVAAGLVAIAAVLTVGGTWPALTGVPAHAAPSLGRDMLIVIAMFGLGLPFALGTRILLAVNRYPLVLLLQGCVPFVTLGVVVWYRDSAAMTPFLIAPFAAQTAVLVAGFIVACRHLQLGSSLLWVLARARSRGTMRRIRAVAGPMLLVTVGLPLALQTDRLVLSHVSTGAALAQYAIVGILFGPAWSVISSAGLTLWPEFASAKAAIDGQPVVAYRRVFRAFVAVGAVGAAAFLGLGPLLTKVWAGSSGGGLLVWLAFALLLLVQAAHLPGGMFLTRPAELRFQARCVGFMCVINLPLSIGLAPIFGAAGPVLASAATICAFQLVPARRRILRSSPDGVAV
jgi:O-antigen/teichoic acid export membrane protein